MPRAVADAVAVQWSGTGTGTVTLGSPLVSFQGFPTSLNGEIVEYVIDHDTASEREAGFGTYASGTNTLTRTYRTFPTKGGAAVSFSSGTKTVRITQTETSTPHMATINPAATDDINAGFLEFRSTWGNRSTNALFFCVDHAAGAAVWTQAGGSTVTGSELIINYDPDNYIPAGSGQTADEHFEGVNNALTGGADATPSQVVSNAAEYVLLLAARMHANAEVRSHQASVDFEVPTSASGGSKWLIKALHDGCFVSVDTNTGSVNAAAGGTARLVNGGVAIVEVDSNPGSAPVVLVRGDVVLAPTDVGTTKTYDNDDHGQEFRLTSTSTQTFGASSGFTTGFEVILYREVAGTITIDGVDADYTLVGPDIVVVKKIGTALLASGKLAGSPIILDAS